MIWAVWHKWPSATQFTFNFHRHWATLVVRDTGDGSGHFLHIKEGVTQGDPIAMISYNIGGPPPYQRAPGGTPLCHSSLVRG